MKYFLCATLLFVTSGLSHANGVPIKLTMDDRPPFHYFDDGKLTGPAIKTLKCTFFAYEATI
ncbi:hypothetical protein [Piscirickettsia litoralis]|uniref:hypothetical protein n=1 Tax=Piscirickettsia litoralis TaxID=1891921 RepID=UPI001F32EEF6|nr:hypothetical protein [Piscirickettsia litoralis]